MGTKKNVWIPLLLVTLFLFGAAAMFAIPSYAASTTTEKFYFHVDPSSSYEVGTINTGGVIFNSTTLGFGSGNTKSGTTSYSQNWYLSQLLAGQISTSGTPTMALDLYASTASQWNYTIQVIEATSTGSTVAVLSQATCSGATGCLSLTTSQALYTISGLSSISATNIPSGDELQISFSISESSGTNSVNLVVENSNTALTSYFTLPLSSPAVTVNSLSISPANIQGSGISTATLSVSDAFGLYDIASHTLTATIPGMSVTPINAQVMTPSASNTQTAYTGTWTYSINPSSTSYGSYGGLWNIQSRVTDQSGNTYSSSVQQLTYSAGGGSCISCTTTSSTQSNGYGGIMSWEILGFPAVYLLGAVIIIIVVGAVAIAVRKT